MVKPLWRVLRRVPHERRRALLQQPFSLHQVQHILFSHCVWNLLLYQYCLILPVGPRKSIRRRLIPVSNSLNVIIHLCSRDSAPPGRRAPKAAIRILWQLKLFNESGNVISSNDPATLHDPLREGAIKLAQAKAPISCSPARSGAGFHMEDDMAAYCESCDWLAGVTGWAYISHDTL